MNELATIKTANPYSIAVQSKRILDEKKPDMMKMIMEVLPKTYYDAGQVMPGHDVKQQTVNLQVLATNLYEEIKSFFPFLKVEEMMLAFRNGVRGEYGDFFGLNIVTFHKWIKGFQTDDRRKRALVEIKEWNEREPEPLMTKEQAFKAWCDTIQTQFERFKETGVFVCANPTHHYRRFQELGLISLTGEQMDAILVRAKESIIKRKKLQRLNPNNHAERKELGDFIEHATKGELTPTEKEVIRVEARRIAIEDYYKTIDKLKL